MCSAFKDNNIKIPESWNGVTNGTILYCGHGEVLHWIEFNEKFDHCIRKYRLTKEILNLYSEFAYGKDECILCFRGIDERTLIEPLSHPDICRLLNDIPVYL